MNPSSRRSLGPQRLLIASLLCLASTLWSATASAQSDKIAEARKHFDQGTEFFRQHRFKARRTGGKDSHLFSNRHS